MEEFLGLKAVGVGDGQGSLACCSPWGHKESDTTEVLTHCPPSSPVHTDEALPASATGPLRR